MSELPATVSPRDAMHAPPERLHPLYLITGLSKRLRGAWGAVAGGVVLGSQGHWPLVAIIAAVAMFVAVGGLFLKWLKLEYRVGADELRIDSGFLSRTSRAIPFDRVTDVDIEQGPLHRLFKLARVRFETGASSGSKDDDGVLDTIALDRAEALRKHVRNRRGPMSIVPVAPQAEDAAPLFAMDRRRVLTAGLFNFSLAVIAALFGVTQTIGDAIGLDPFRRRFWIDLADRSEPLRDLMIAHQYLAAIGGTLVLVVVGAGTGVVRTALREHGFRLDRTETGLRRRRGLITLTDVSIPVKRVQASIFATGPIRRHFGWFTLKLQSLAQDGGKGDHVVAPLARDDQAADIQASIGQPLLPHSDWRPVSRAYVLSLIAMMTPALIASLIAALIFGPWVLLWLLGAAVGIGLRFLKWRRTRFALDPETLFVEQGWWRQRRTILPIRCIQSLDLTESFWTRRFGAVALRFGVAGSKGLPLTIPALSRADAEAMRGAMLA